MIPELQGFFLICGLVFTLWWLFWYFGRDGRLIREWAQAKGWRIAFQEYRTLGHDPFGGGGAETQVVYVECVADGGARYKGYLRIPPWRLHRTGRVRWVSLDNTLRQGV